MTIAGARTAVVAFVIAIAVLLAVEIFAAAHLRVASQPTLVGTAITLDLVIGLPALAWFLVLRRSRSGSIALVPVAIVGFVAARTLVPAPHNVAVIAFERSGSCSSDSRLRADTRIVSNSR